MSDFKIAFEKTLAHEGGYVHDTNDPGGETYKGIARNMHSKWEGWVRVDSAKHQSGFPSNMENDKSLQEAVQHFYQVSFWDVLNGDNIQSQEVAETLFDFAVNAGVRTAVVLAQMVVGTEADGILGPHTLEKMNATIPDYFLPAYTVAKIARYISIVKRRPESKKYFFGWVCRAIDQS